MSVLVAAILGVVEGLTEYLPVSSTGHLILVGRWLGDSSEASQAFDIVIQLGAILAVLVVYGKLLADRLQGLARGQAEAIRLFSALAAGFAPAAVIGLIARKWIKAHLFGPLPVAAALIAGGILMIVTERVRKARHIHGVDGLEHVTVKRGFFIGIAQCFAMWPGMSRSMSTIVGGQLTGLSTATAAEFSFLLGLPTLGAACLYEAFKSRHELMLGSPVPLIVGLVVSFLVAWAVVAFFIRYLQRHGLEPFGYYRIALGALVLFLVLS
jgi:undecaprenyl-diphosphatase